MTNFKDYLNEQLKDPEFKAEYDALEPEFLKLWDPDFTKVTPEEREQIEAAERSGFIDDAEIDWDNIGKK